MARLLLVLQRCVCFSTIMSCGHTNSDQSSGAIALLPPSLRLRYLRLAFQKYQIRQSSSTDGSSFIRDTVSRGILMVPSNVLQ